MALSKSIQKAQIPLPCELCEIETKIQWKCIDCNLLLCDKCKNKVHSKIKEAKNHKIYTIKEVGLQGDGSGQILDFSDISCKDHSGQVCCLFCKTCDHLVCPTGVTKTHKTHELVEIEKAFMMKKDVLKITIEKLKKQHEDWIKNNEILDTLKETNKLSIDQTQKDIQNQKQIWKQAGDQYATELGSEFNKQCRLKEEAIETERSKVKHFEQHLTNKIQLIEDMSISMDMTKFFEDTKSLDNMKEMPNVNLNQSQLQRFVPGQIVQKIVRIKAIKEYTTELGVVTRIIPFSKNTFWIHGLVPNTIQKVTLQPDSTIKVLKQINEYAFQTARTRNGDLLISDKTSNVKVLIGNKNKLTISKHNVTPYIVKAIHIYKENQLIVGAVKNAHIDYIIPGGGVVMVMDMDGNHEAKYEFDKNNKPLLTDPKGITTTKNGNIFIIDITTEDQRGRVVILEKGTVHNIYTGHPDINSQNHPFKLCSTVATPNDNVIVSDMFNNTLHFLDHSGHLLAYCNTVEDDILLPYSMLCCEPGKLFIGSSIPEIGNHRAKIYEVKIPNNL
ncbi:unnamed protein product [Mytilus coruscus]|uniref:B box-type domain-containing protein n=1 Tax=Mytilus coruscus TaxID=42192 RepID=A0A6J8EF62_MYTCO|nr:unnamed protein product [Mytilus coruscus]